MKGKQDSALIFQLRVSQYLFKNKNFLKNGEGMPRAGIWGGDQEEPGEAK